MKSCPGWVGTCVPVTHSRDIVARALAIAGEGRTAYPKIIDECAASMRTVIGTSVRCWPRPSNDVEVYAYSKRWPEVFPQHGPGKKHLRTIALVDWQNALVGRHPERLLRTHPVRRLPVHEHRARLALPAVLLQQPLSRHPRALLRGLRPGRRALDHRAAHGVRLPQGGRRTAGRVIGPNS